jgi:hypothetical protein
MRLDKFRNACVNLQKTLDTLGKRAYTPFIVKIALFKGLDFLFKALISSPGVSDENDHVWRDLRADAVFNTRHLCHKR